MCVRDHLPRHFVFSFVHVVNENVPLGGITLAGLSFMDDATAFASSAEEKLRKLTMLLLQKGLFSPQPLLLPKLALPAITLPLLLLWTLSCSCCAPPSSVFRGLKLSVVGTVLEAGLQQLVWHSSTWISMDGVNTGTQTHGALSHVFIAYYHSVSFLGMAFPLSQVPCSIRYMCKESTEEKKW